MLLDPVLEFPFLGIGYSKGYGFFISGSTHIILAIDGKHREGGRIWSVFFPSDGKKNSTKNLKNARNHRNHLIRIYLWKSRITIIFKFLDGFFFPPEGKKTTIKSISWEWGRGTYVYSRKYKNRTPLGYWHIQKHTFTIKKQKKVFAQCFP